jgi:hypothetical protein
MLKQKLWTKSEKCLHTPKLKGHMVVNVYIKGKHKIRYKRKPNWGRYGPEHTPKLRGWKQFNLKSKTKNKSNIQKKKKQERNISHFER